jgi:hypothetical protein
MPASRTSEILRPSFAQKRTKMVQLRAKKMGFLYVKQLRALFEFCYTICTICIHRGARYTMDPTFRTFRRSVRVVREPPPGVLLDFRPPQRLFPRTVSRDSRCYAKVWSRPTICKHPPASLRPRTPPPVPMTLDPLDPSSSSLKRLPPRTAVCRWCTCRP